VITFQASPRFRASFGVFVPPRAALAQLVEHRIRNY